MYHDNFTDVGGGYVADVLAESYMLKELYMHCNAEGELKPAAIYS